MWRLHRRFQGFADALSSAAADDGRITRKEVHEVEVDIEALRADLLDMCGTTAFVGDAPAMLDVWDIESADADDLLRKADELGVDVRELCP